MSKFETLCNEYRENRRLIEELEAMNDSLKADIITIMGDRDTVTEGAAKATYKSVISSRIDTKALEKVHPDIVDAFTKQTSYKRFTVA